MNSRFAVISVLAILLLSAVFFLRFSAYGTEIVWNLSDGGRLMLPLVGIAALIDSINPCAFSILLLTIGFLFSLGQMRSGILRIGGAYILGVFAVYVLIGLGILQALHLFNTPHFMAKVGASLLIAFGAINVINEFFPSFPIKLRVPQAAHHKIAELMEKASMPTAFLLGALVGLCEFPCTGGPYLLVLGLLHDSATYFRGFGYLLLYNFIFVLPLAVILFVASEEKLIQKVRAWQSRENRLMRFGGGVAMIALGALMFLL